MIIVFTESANADFLRWRRIDPRKAERIEKLCKEIALTPFEGIGKPEPLRFDLQGYWSRRIDHTHRLVYTVKKKTVTIISCRYHY
ncbi:MAG: Txe/YoeB family addiction module toxin [Candidatus Peregrinibacteria bacterium]